MESAAERKARLKALRQEAAAAEDTEAARPVAPAANAAPEPPTLKFRNYAPRDEKIEHQKVFLVPGPQVTRLCQSGPNRSPVVAAKHT